jgi:RhtB (resistance to homoserine/threonine) family protein
VIDSQVIAFAVAAALLTIAPGPDTMLVLRNVLRGGRRDGVVTTFGICSGLFAHAALSAFGVSLLLERSATAFSAVKVVGACYLVWLGLQSLLKGMRGAYASVPVETVDRLRRSNSRRSFVEGLLSNLLNPKTAVFYLAFLPQFISPSDDVLKKSLLLASIHYCEAVLWLVALSSLFDRMQRFILKSAVRRWLDRVCGAALIGFGARLAFERR